MTRVCVVAQRAVSSVGASKRSESVSVSKAKYSYIKPKNEVQQNFIKLLRTVDNPYIVIGYGKAGTGKTRCSVGVAMEKLLDEQVKRIVLTRPPVCVEDQDIGFLPGTIEKKMNPWLMPVFDSMLDYVSQAEIDSMIKNRTIDIAPLAFMRGRTFNDSFVICDEAQNMTRNQMLMLLTRLGSGSKMVILGDPEQHDSIEGGQNALTDLVTRIHNHNTQYDNILNDKIAEVYFDESAITRHMIIPHILDMYRF